MSSSPTFMVDDDDRLLVSEVDRSLVRTSNRRCFRCFVVSKTKTAVTANGFIFEFFIYIFTYAYCLFDMFLDASKTWYGLLYWDRTGTGT